LKFNDIDYCKECSDKFYDCIAFKIKHVDLIDNSQIKIKFYKKLLDYK
jgi:hypothetical protein